MNKSINNGDRPVAIDNTLLLAKASDLILKGNLKLDKDFIIITEKI